MDIWCIYLQSMKNLVLFGATGGIGSQLLPLLKNRYNVIAPKRIAVDVTNINSVKNFFANNDIDIVLNFSGTFYSELLIDMDDISHAKETVDVNIMGNINILSACLPQMIGRGFGRVICASSIFSTMNVPYSAVYSGTKAFLDRFIGAANRESIKHGVTCNTIQLGYWDGGMAYRIDESLQEAAKRKIGLHRFGKIKELNNAINFIIETEYVCGTNLKIDGGL